MHTMLLNSKNQNLNIQAKILKKNSKAMLFRSPVDKLSRMIPADTPIIGTWPFNISLGTIGFAIGCISLIFSLYLWTKLRAMSLLLIAQVIPKANARAITFVTTTTNWQDSSTESSFTELYNPNASYFVMAAISGYMLYKTFHIARRVKKAYTNPCLIPRLIPSKRPS